MGRNFHLSSLYGKRHQLVRILALNYISISIFVINYTFWVLNTGICILAWQTNQFENETTTIYTQYCIIMVAWM